MIAIRSEQGYPRDGQILASVDYVIGSPSEGAILLIGKDRQGREYGARKTTGTSYKYPSGIELRIPRDGDKQKNYPALFFGFRLNSSRWQPKTTGGWLEAPEFNDDFFSKFDLELMDENMQSVSVPDPEIEREFKMMAFWGRYELHGLLRNHFWGEMYFHRSPAWEKFLAEFENGAS